MRFFKDTNYNFVKYGRVAFIVSSLLIITTATSLILKGGPSLSIDFAGGINIHIKTTESVDVDKLNKIRNKLDVDQINTVGVNSDRLFIQNKGIELASEITEAVIEYRESVGNIESLEELKDIPEMKKIDFNIFTEVFSAGKVSTVKTSKVEGEEETLDTSTYTRVNINTIDKDKMVERIQEVIIKDLTEEIKSVLSQIFPSEYKTEDKIDLNAINDDDNLKDLLGQILAQKRANEIADKIIKHRGLKAEIAEIVLIKDFDELKSIADLNTEELNSIKKHFYLRKFEIEGTEIVGPRVSQEITRTAILALLYATIGMLIYIAFRFDFRSGVVAIIALVHDVFIVLGVCSIFNIEMSLTVIAAFLTTVGYSINDTVVYYDRIREGLLQQRKETYAESLNRCINENLSRTILTGISALLVLIVLFFKGGKALRDFSVVLIAGIIMGTYSSIYVAAPLLIEWNRLSARRKVKRGRKR